MIGTTTTLRKICGMKKRIRVICGGQGSSKTYSILMILINHCSSNPNKRCMIVSKELAKMRTNVIPDFQSIMKEFNIFNQNNWNDSKALYSFPNGSTIQFYGTDKEDAGKGTRNHLLFLNEANKIPFNAYRELSSRADNIFIDYNPNIKCWIDTEVIPDTQNAEFLRVTYKDNEFLGEAEKQSILDYKTKAYNEDGTVKSEYWANVWKVYGLGEIGSFVGTILTDLTMGEFDDTLPFVYGYDAGFQDQDGLVKVAVDKKQKIIYVDECLYQNHLSTGELVSIVKNIVGNNLVVCDSAAARTVEDFKKGHINAVSCSKAKIVEDIKEIQGYKIVYTPRSVNFVDEVNNWRWKDNARNIPEDGNLHTVDPTRYAFRFLTTPQPKPNSVIVPNEDNKIWKNRAYRLKHRNSLQSIF